MELHDYQRQAVQHLHDNPRSGLFLEMGLGKTAVCLSALQPHHLPALVVAPKRVAEHVWSAETQKWRPDLRCEIAAGNPSKRAQALGSGADIVAIGRDNIKDVQPRHPFKTVILDELSGFKSRVSKRFKHAAKITKDTPHVWGLTGTPAPNGYLDLWSQVFLLDRGERLGKGITHYRNRWFVPGGQLPNGVITGWDLRGGAEDKIKALISDICLSMQAVDHLDLQPVTYNPVSVELPASARKTYNEMEKDLVTYVELVDNAFTASTAAVATNKLSQIASGWLYNDERLVGYHELHKEKLNAVQEIVDGTGSSVLVFYRYVSEADEILAGVDGAHHISEHRVLEAWDRGEVPVLVAHPQSAGHGLNLQHGGHTIIWTTLPWSLEDYQQANGRLARQGQTQPVVIHQLLAEGTIDQAILHRLGGKASVQDALLEYLKKLR